MTQVANAAGIGSFLSALESARAGIARGTRGLAADAQKIAHANVDKDSQLTDLSDALVQSIVDRIQVQASARMVGTVDETLGTLINTTA
ncbi:MAG TPA: hypothetical protein VE046_06410 [Steroidobacteraceae bacterium]|nr:hypothetical protein [Steroidobacteraceae bacterium]